MREIKFRAWDGKQMNDEFMLSLEGEVLSPETIPFMVRKDVVLMQFTGLTTDKGVEVYEGDIVSRSCLDENCNLMQKGVVVYDEEWCMYFIDTGDGLAPLVHGEPSRGVTLPVTVHGNVHEHPHLLDKSPEV